MFKTLFFVALLIQGLLASSKPEAAVDETGNCNDKDNATPARDSVKFTGQACLCGDWDLDALVEPTPQHKLLTRAADSGGTQIQGGVLSIQWTESSEWAYPKDGTPDFHVFGADGLSSQDASCRAKFDTVVLETGTTCDSDGFRTWTISGSVDAILANDGTGCDFTSTALGDAGVNPGQLSVKLNFGVKNWRWIEAVDGTGSQTGIFKTQNAQTMMPLEFIFETIIEVETDIKVTRIVDAPCAPGVNSCDEQAIAARGLVKRAVVTNLMGQAPSVELEMWTEIIYPFKLRFDTTLEGDVAVEDREYFKPETGTWSNPDDDFETVSVWARKDGPDDVGDCNAGGKCEKTWTYTVKVADGAIGQKCSFSGVYSVEFKVGCQPSSTSASNEDDNVCPKMEGDERVTIEFTVNSGNHCMQLADTVTIAGFLQVYDSDPKLAEATPFQSFANNQIMWFRAYVTSEQANLASARFLKIDILEDDSVIATVFNLADGITNEGAALGLQVFSYGKAEAEVHYGQISYATDESLHHGLGLGPTDASSTGCDAETTAAGLAACYLMPSFNFISYAKDVGAPGPFKLPVDREQTKVFTVAADIEVSYNAAGVNDVAERRLLTLTSERRLSGEEVSSGGTHAEGRFGLQASQDEDTSMVGYSGAAWAAPCVSLLVFLASVAGASA